MNLKSYSRGIGAGIIVTAIIMGIASNKRTITDEEAINRAKELGYTQSSVLTQTSASDTGEDKKISLTSSTDSATSISIVSIEENKEDEVKDPADKKDDDNTSVSDKTSASDSASLPEAEDDKGINDSSASDSSSVSATTSAGDTTSKDTSNSSDTSTSVEDPDDKSDAPVSDGESVLIVINKGDSSVTVSRRMYEAGLVESAVEFDKFLCDNGYDKYLAVGEYEIIAGLDFDTMAKIITRRKMY